MTPRNQDESAAATLRDGFDLHQSGDLKGAERCYRRILKKDKTHVEALYLLGSLHLQTGDYKRAEVGLRAALAEQPTHAQALYNLARVLMDTDRYAEAETQLHLVISAQPNNVSALRNLGVTCLSLGKSKAAAPPLETAVQ
ncbi:MAG: tetratricopeptide repeat protein, partial [Rhodospirillaceae bacterium]|nr:tetratricopeptide repeat protein [Rhodospirillaceae bacterium]